MPESAMSELDAQKNQGDPALSSEMDRRILYTLLEPPVRLAYTLNVPLKELVGWVQMAYYHEAKRNGLKVQGAAKLLQVTPRTISNLAQKLKLNFLNAVEAQDLLRQVEFVLWAGPLSEVRLCNALPEDPEAVKRALARLLEQGRVVETRGRTITYRIARHEVRQPRDTWLARIDGLSNLLGSVTNAVYGRFFREEPQTFARTITLRVRPEDMERFSQIYEALLWKELVEIDAAAADDPDALKIDLSYVWAPVDYIKRFWGDRDAGDQ